MAHQVHGGRSLSFTLAALVLRAILVTLMAKLKARAQHRLQSGNLGDDGKGGETNPLAYIDDYGAAVYVEDILFFLEELHRLGKPIDCHLNFNKTRIMTSINVTSSIASITQKHGKVISNSIELSLDTFSISTSIVHGKPTSTHVEIITGLYLLGQPPGSTLFARSFFADRLQANMEDSAKLTDSVPEPHTALRLFT